MNSALPLPALLVLSVCAILCIFVYVVKAKRREPSLYITGAILMGTGLIGETFVELKGEFTEFTTTEIISVFVITVGTVFMVFGRYNQIKHDAIKKRQATRLLTFACVCFGLALLIGLYGYVRN